MRLLVCGSRTWSCAATIHAHLDALAPTILIHGAARGADAIADRWAMRVVCLKWPANWANGRRAGPQKNAKMLAESQPDRGLAFGPLWRLDMALHRWIKTGTGDMVSRMLLAGLPVRWVAAPRFLPVDLPNMPDPRVDALARSAP